MDKYPSAAALCREFAIQANKNLGQNFLDKPESIKKMLSVFALSEGNHVLEIGPGLGHLTHALLNKGVSLTSIEIDERFLPILDRISKMFPKFNLVLNDARLLDWSDFLKPDVDNYIFANLPYYLSTELFIKGILEGYMAKGISFLLQREVAQKFAAVPGTKEYGPPAILAKVYGEVCLGQRISAGAFYPPPTVESQVIILHKHDTNLVEQSHITNLYDFLEKVFSNRRKTIRNNLKYNYEKDLSKSARILALEEDMKIDLGRRAETFSAQELVFIFEMLSLPA